MVSIVQLLMPGEELSLENLVKLRDQLKGRAIGEEPAQQPVEEESINGHGSLIFDNVGNTTYIGEAGPFAFRIKLYEFLIYNPQFPESRGTFSQESQSGLGIGSSRTSIAIHRVNLVLPDREQADILVDDFFSKIQSIVWVYPKNYFQLRYEATYEDRASVMGDQNWVCSLYLIFALGYWLQDDTHAAELSNLYYNFAKQLVYEAIEQSSESGVRTLLLMVGKS